MPPALGPDGNIWQSDHYSPDDRTKAYPRATGHVQAWSDADLVFDVAVMSDARCTVHQHMCAQATCRPDDQSIVQEVAVADAVGSSYRPALQCLGHTAASMDDRYRGDGVSRDGFLVIDHEGTTGSEYDKPHAA